VAGVVGATPGILAGVAVGGAATVALQPAFEVPRQDAWSRNANRILDVGLLARLVAQGGIDLSEAAAEAKRDGFGPDKLDALIYLSQTVPGFADALDLWRRGLIGDGLFQHVLVKAGLDQRYSAPLQALKDAEILTPEQLAVMIQRTVVANPGILPNQPDTADSNVPPMPQVGIDPITEAAHSGFNEERLAAMARIIGLPASPDLAARMHFRKIITEGAYNQAILEGNTRGEWAPFLLDGFREIPTAEQFVEAHLRGWVTKPEMYAGTARHGMSQADTDLEFQIHRRPLTPHAIKQGLARGANFNPEAGELQDPYEASVHQNNLGPEWYELAISLAGSYPSLFITNRLVTQGTITPTQGRTWMQKSGMADEVVTALHDSWTGGTTATADAHSTKAQNQLWTTTHRSYVAEEIDDATATTALSAAGVAAAAVPAILALWAQERSLIRKQLSPTQIRKALNLGVVNPATGVPWTIADAHAALLLRGYDDADATVFLQE
jgi:hypothetical protein